MLAAGWSAGQSLSIVCWCVSSGFGQFGPVCCGLDPDWIGFVWLPRRRPAGADSSLSPPPRLRETVLQDCSPGAEAAQARRRRRRDEGRDHPLGRDHALAALPLAV